MPTFARLKSGDDIREVIKTAFDADLAISGSWGYSQEEATVIEAATVPLLQLEHMLASMRAYIEMNMTLPAEERYGSINLNETQREQIQKGDLVYDKVTYEITAMKEERYTAFINEYKEGLGKEDFDITEHFNQRKKATISRYEVYWFEVHLTL
jgi:predicted small secreted protein